MTTCKCSEASRRMPASVCCPTLLLFTFFKACLNAAHQLLRIGWRLLWTQASLMILKARPGWCWGCESPSCSTSLWFRNSVNSSFGLFHRAADMFGSGGMLFNSFPPIGHQLHECIHQPFQPALIIHIQRRTLMIELERLFNSKIKTRAFLSAAGFRSLCQGPSEISRAESTQNPNSIRVFVDQPRMTGRWLRRPFGLLINWGDWSVCN